MDNIFKQLTRKLFLLIVTLIPITVSASPILLNLEGSMTTLDVMYYDGAWSNLEPHTNLLEPPTIVGEGERIWTISGTIVIDDQVLSQDREDYIRGRSGDFNILSYNINFGNIYNISDNNPTDIFWLGPDSSLRLGSFDFGTGGGSRLDSGSYLSNYSSPWLDYNSYNTIKIDFGTDIFAAIVHTNTNTNTHISSWQNIISVSEPSSIYLLVLVPLVLVVARQKA